MGTSNVTYTSSGTSPVANSNGDNGNVTNWLLQNSGNAPATPAPATGANGSAPASPMGNNMQWGNGHHNGWGLFWFAVLAGLAIFGAVTLLRKI